MMPSSFQFPCSKFAGFVGLPNAPMNMVVLSLASRNKAWFHVDSTLSMSLKRVFDRHNDKVLKVKSFASQAVFVSYPGSVPYNL